MSQQNQTHSTIEIQHIQKKYGKRQVVKDVSMYINSGEIVGLLGPNGAGKTTSFYMIVGLVKADAGKILIDQQDITRAPVYKRAHYGLSYLPQEASIFRGLNVEDNIMAILELQPEYTNKKERLQILNTLLDDLQIQHIRTQSALALSGGERRRVEIARTLATNPRFVLLDEPFAGVDPIAVSDIQNIILFLQKKGIGILVTDHNVRETLGICNRAYIISEGTVLASGLPQEIVNNELVRKVYLGEHFALN
jgi:lipopolysaccharide export system ATP-binding protein